MIDPKDFNLQGWAGFEEWLHALIVRMSKSVHRSPMRGIFKKIWWGGERLKAQVTEIELLPGELNDCEVMQHYGFRSRVPVGSEGVAIAIGGRSHHMIVIATEKRDTVRDDLQEGEVVIYSKFGQAITLGTDGNVHIKSNNGASTVEIKANGEVLLNGEGPGVARIGDTILIDGNVVINGAPPVSFVGTGTIITGSSTVKAG